MTFENSLKQEVDAIVVARLKSGTPIHLLGKIVYNELCNKVINVSSLSLTYTVIDMPKDKVLSIIDSVIVKYIL